MNSELVNKGRSCIGLINPKSPENVASVLRAAGNYQVERVFYTGRRYSLAVKNKSNTINVARKISQNIPVLPVNHIVDELPKTMKLVCVEFVENAIPLPDYQHPINACYVFGPEDGSISQQVIDSADSVVFIPTQGCMNLAATVNVVLYDRLAKSLQFYQRNEMIRQNRDVNNRLKVTNDKLSR